MTPRVRAILEDVCARHRVTIAELQGLSTERRIAWARQEAMALIYATGKYSLYQTGQALNRDHSTAYHAIKRVKERAGEAA